MNSICRKAALALVGAAFLTAAAPRPGLAQGGAVVCVNCSTAWAQYLEYTKQIAQLEQQIKQVRLALQNTTALARFPKGTGLSGFRDANSILSQSKALSFTTPDIDALFDKKFKDFNGYAGMKLDDQTMVAKHQQWSDDANSRTKTTLKAAAKHNQQIQGEEEQALQGFQAQGESAQGNLEAMQTLIALNIELVRQIQKLRQEGLMTLQLDAGRDQDQNDQKATEEARRKQMTKMPEIPTTGGKTYSGGNYSNNAK